MGWTARFMVASMSSAWAGAVEHKKAVKSIEMVVNNRGDIKFFIVRRRCK